MPDTPLLHQDPRQRQAQGEFHRLSRAGILLGLIAVVTGTIVLVGWWRDVPLLKSVVPGSVYMKANTAAGFILAGLALALWSVAARVIRPLALACGGATALIGLLTLCEYVFGLDLGVDQLLFHAVPGVGSTLAPGRMTPVCASCFVLLGGALTCVGCRRTLRVAQGMLLLTGVLALLSLLGHLYGVTAHYGIGQYTQTAIHTAVLFLLVSLGVHLQHPTDGIMRAIQPDTMGGWLLRRMLPFLVAGPLLLGWLRVQGERKGYFEGPSGVALMMTTMMGLFTVLVAWTGRRLTVIEILRRKSEADLHDALCRLRENDVRLRAITDSAQDAILMMDPKGRVAYWNPAAERIFGYTPAEALGRSLHDLIAPPRYHAAHRAAFPDFCRTGHGAAVGQTLELQGCRKDRREIAIALSLSAVQLGGQWHAIGILRDITQSKLAERQLIESNSHLSQLNQDLQSAATQIKGLMTDVVSKNTFTGRFANSGLVPCWESKKCGHTSCPSYGNKKNLRCWEIAGTFCQCKHHGKFAQKFHECTQCEIYQRSRINPIVDLGETFNTMLTILEDRHQELLHTSFHDALTDLPNRALFRDRLQQAVLRSQRLKGYRFAVLFLDFDRFKNINDSLGHDVGDLLLQEIGRRLRTTVRTGDSLADGNPQHTTARLGGDEFVILLDGLARPDDATIVARRLLESLAQPYNLRNHEVFATASIGIVTSDMPAESADQVLRDADTAMYEAKLAGKGRFVVFSPPMRQRVQKRLNLENDLRKALDAGQLFLVYEPIISLVTGQIDRYEALVRWQHPERGLVMPGEFIPIAEETGLILPIGEWVLRTACEQLARWHATLGDAAPPGINVNLSRTQLLLHNLPETIRGILQQTGLPPSCLHLEVTESAVMKDVPAAIRTLNAIKAIGVKLDMDDFGTGYSSLACLHEFPIDVLKIDRSFINNIGRGRDYAALVHAVTQLARNLNIQVVAEGIETTDQSLILQSLDCDFGQGYLFSKPMTADQVPHFKPRPPARANPQTAPQTTPI